jgi:DNA-binding Lrp family transcriptional regulator
MGDLTELFGKTPRVQLIEALTRLGPIEVTRGELAQEAGLYRTSTNREIGKLEREGVILRVSKGKHPKYSANASLAELKLVAYLDTALGDLRLRRERALETTEVFRRIAWQTVSLTATVISNPMSEVDATVQTGSQVTKEVESVTASSAIDVRA